MIIDKDSFVELATQLQQASGGLLAAIKTLEPAEDEAILQAVDLLLGANENIGHMVKLMRAIHKANLAERPDPRVEGTEIS